jgi:DNA-3-methyladenine glycosylase II
LDDGKILPLVQKHGPPPIYNSLSQQGCRHDGAKTTLNEDSQPKTCFQSLCRIIAGQQLAGAAAKTVWNRLLQTTSNHLTPERILALVEQGNNMEDCLQKPAGISGAKARSIVALAQAFQEDSDSISPQHIHIINDGEISYYFLTKN